MMVPSILVSGQATQVTVTAFVGGANANTQVQLFNLASGTAVLVGNMNDNGQNGDQTAGDQVYSIATTISAPAAASLPLQVVASPGTSANFSVQVLQVPSYVTNTEVNQAETQIYTTAIQTRTNFSSPDWSKQTLLQGISSNLTSMYGQFSGVVNQNANLQSALALSHRASTRARPADSAAGDAGDALTSGLLSPAQNAASCDELVESLGGFRGSYPNALSLNDPRLLQFAQELTTICANASSCQGAFTQDDFLGSNVAAAEWAHEYIVTGQALPTSISGCGGGVTQSLASVAVKSELQQFTDMAGDGIASLANLGQIGMQALGSATDYMLGWFVDGSGNQGITVAQTAPTETFVTPTGTYNAAISLGGDSANATITNTPVYPNSITNISPLPGIILWLDPPEIQSFSPTFGPVGTPVTLSGYGFNPPSGSLTSINFNGVNATVSSATDSSMTVVVPPGATTGPITVLTTVGETMSSISFTVTASAGNPVPTITSLNPSSLATGATPQTLTINGAGFLNSSTVTFNGISHAATFVNASQLTISLTSADLAIAGTFLVVVTNPAPGGGASLAANFTVTNGQTAGEWTWMSGSPPVGGQTGPSGVYGVKGVPAAANVPGARNSAVSWTDSIGNHWLFGGWGVDSNATEGYLNDLWEYNPTTNIWTWMSGSSTVVATGAYGTTGVYGTKGVPAATNVPSVRYGAVSWTDSIGNLWLFGGTDTYSLTEDPEGCLNDLWEYNPTTNMWTWMSGSNTSQRPGTYGAQGIPSTDNVPGGRCRSVSWTDKSGNLWLFGGLGYDSTGTFGLLNDLWEFNPTTNMWTWMSGSNTIGAVGSYGTQGITATTNIPSAREFSVSWTDKSGNLWLFGGTQSDPLYYQGTLSDLWKFNPTTNMWTWVSGSSAVQAAGVYGTQGVASVGNVPGARYWAVSWTDSSGNLWLFSGNVVQNDLWEFSPTTNMWTWMSGSSTSGPTGVYGILGVPAASNVPGERGGAISWTDKSGYLWLFGGTGLVGPDRLNDLWRYQPQ
jgi:N-acetylneuraminic acid mutarotase